MIDKVNKKMAEHVEAILNKPIITNEDFALLANYLAKLEAAEASKKYEAEREERDKRFQTLTAALAGGM